MFENCNNLRVVNIPNGIKSIPSKAFKNCSALPEIEIPYSVKDINSDAFNGCSSLAMIDIPSSVEEIDGDAFNNCHSLMTVIIRAGKPVKIKKSSFGKATQRQGIFYVPMASVYRSDPKSAWFKIYNIKNLNDRQR